MTKLPEPCCPVRNYKEVNFYTYDQMIQFRRDALEEAIERIEALREDWGDLAEESGMRTAINEIRKMKDET